MGRDFVDRIYEAAAFPEFWPELFHDLATALGFAGAAMVSVNPEFKRHVASPGVAGMIRRFLSEGWQTRDLRSERAAALGHGGFVRDQDLASDEEIATHPLYVELLRPSGLGYGAATIVDCPSGDTIAVSFDRSWADGPTPQEILAELDKLRPHFARAAVFAGRLELERAQAQASALAGVGFPAAVLGGHRRLLAANADFEALRGRVRIGAGDRLSLADPACEALLGRALEAGCETGLSIPLKATGGDPPAVMHVLPVRRTARDAFSLAEWLIVVTPIGAGAAPLASILSGLFDLSRAEARVAREVIGGESVTAIAVKFGLSEATVRSQLRAVFAKTGTSRQSELVAACLGVAPPAVGAA
ncbi:helix-turn-helix transcriptional regulator [Chelatococcus sambhunathii]|uniref:Helix-turn-helix transcriptional regulator n=1 Tax=Chelatococcus sambhunathii TaxID=363953 RepID=A0ABU1DAU9_9HYPH|nr:helix-turn-helix transcriptional regulator [Chelatococcus sambhunathii]MDR4305227.1 helix-turn-helix transcriptional regulator [Chelatococcus sambhunathii]